MAAKSSTDEEQAMLANMDVSLSNAEMQEKCDRFVTPAFILLAWEPVHPDSRKLENIVIKYSYCHGSATTSKTQTIRKASALACLCNTAYMFRAELHTVVKWKGKPLAIMPSEPGKRIFTTFVNGMSLPVGRVRILETGDIISCYELDQPEADFDSILASTSFDNDGDGPEGKKLTKSILHVLAIMAMIAIVIIFVVVVLGAVVIAILSLIMPQAFSFSNLVRFFRHNA
ncbi:hypothetical protein BFW01_g11760 [Lasiodiplodia theobromae]|nr:hypothetical protein BFW01_g11760 [Lasiodiplodia theobromae]